MKIKTASLLLAPFSLLRLFTFVVAVLAAQVNAQPASASPVGAVVDDSFRVVEEESAAYSFPRWLPGEKILTLRTTEGADSTNSLVRLNHNGSTDQNFGVALSDQESVTAVAASPDGSFYVSSDWWFYGSITRYHADGALDATFHAPEGIVGSAMVVQPDGKLILNAASYPEYPYGPAVVSNHLVRLSADGTIDPSFSADLVVDGAWSTAQHNDWLGFVDHLVLQPDGKILVGGTFSGIGGISISGLARLNPDGTVDMTFAPAAVSALSAVALQSDGKIIVADREFWSSSLVVLRLNTDGSIDPTFSSGIEYAWDIAALAVQADGKIIVTGTQLVTDLESFTFFNLLRLEDDGAVDLSFTSDIRGESLLLQGDGHVIVAANGTLQRLLNDSNVGAGSVEFDSVSFEASEAANPTITLTVRRTGGSRGAASIRLGTSGGATVGEDFTVLGTSIYFADGDTMPRTITFHIRDDLAPEGTETIRVMLASTTGAMTVGTLSFADIMVLDDDVAVEFESPTLTVREDQRQAVVQVRRVGAADKAFSVEVLTIPGTASYATDYHAVICNVSFGPGQMDRLVLIPIVDDGETESDETFRVGLSVENARSLLLGANALCTVRIADNDRPGTLDTAFVPANFGAPAVLALQPDGRVLLGGVFSDPFDDSHQTVLGLLRLLPGGTLDAGFIASGFSRMEPNSMRATAIAVQADGRILVAFREHLPNTNSANRLHVGLLRLLADGMPDPSFQPVRIGTPSGFDLGDQSIVTLALQSDGRVVLGGKFQSVNGVSRNGIARVLPNGLLDMTFEPGSGAFHVYALALQPDGRILVGGLFEHINGSGSNSIARLNPNGSVDTTFNTGSGARIESEFSQRGIVSALLIQGDGRVLVGGSFNQFNNVDCNSLVRLYPDGSIDRSFEPGLPYRLPTLRVPVAVGALAVQSDAKILIGGYFCDFCTTNSGLLRLNVDGSLDVGFQAQLSAGSGVSDLALKPDGDIFAAGSFWSVEGVERPGLARLNGGASRFEFHSPVRLTNGRMRLNFAMPRGQSYLLQASSDLVTWLDLNNGTPLRDSTEFTDPGATGAQRRFYRAVQLP